MLSQKLGRISLYPATKEFFPFLNLVRGRAAEGAGYVLNSRQVHASGNKRIAGVLTREGKPAELAYRVYRRVDGALVGSGVSGKDGRYELIGAPEALCYLVVLDSQDEFNAGILDRLQPEA